MVSQFIKCLELSDSFLESLTHFTKRGLKGKKDFLRMSESDLSPGVCYFLTISLSVDYIPSLAMKELVRKLFPCNLFAVVETGDNGKKHFHCIGKTNKRQDNIRRSIKTLLGKEHYEVDDRYSIEVLPEPNMFWRLGYFQKDKDKDVLFSDFTEGQIKLSSEHYATKPKRVRTEKRGSALTIRQLADACIDANCQTESEIRDFLRHCKRDGRMPYDLYKKLGVKSFIAYVTESFDV